jgi:protein TonB
MSLESEPVSAGEWGSLQSCLVGGDPEQRSLERYLRRRALVISIATQSVILAAIVLIPLFAKPEKIAARAVPIPPYYTHRAQPAGDRIVERVPRRPADPRIFDPSAVHRPVVVVRDPSPDPGPEPIQGGWAGPPGPATTSQIPILDTRVPEQPQTHRVETPKIVHVTHLDPAMLTRRIEPKYPALMRQIGRSGQVQLRAIIGTDGAIQSLQVVGGDPGFFQSALEAVGQWHYKPTVLNDNPVEVDTFITVIYNISR